VERDGQAVSRWTDGDAVLPLPGAPGIATLEIHFAGAMTFVLNADHGSQTETRAA
jgi:hypothetical protein